MTEYIIIAINDPDEIIPLRFNLISTTSSTSSSVDTKTYRNPNAGRGINFGYVHFADMSKWKDPKGRLTTDAFRAAGSGVLLKFFTLIVFEGNVPTQNLFQFSKFQNFNLQHRDRIHMFRRLSNNPVFLNYVTLVASNNPNSPLLHIDRRSFLQCRGGSRKCIHHTVLRA